MLQASNGATVSQPTTASALDHHWQSWLGAVSLLLLLIDAACVDSMSVALSHAWHTLAKHEQQQHLRLHLHLHHSFAIERAVTQELPQMPCMLLAVAAL